MKLHWLVGMALMAACLAAATDARANERANERANAALQQARWVGVVTYVVDGDTVYVRPVQGGKPVSIRVDGIDAPEICQQGGLVARDVLRRRVSGQQVVVDGRSRDDHGRLLGKILLDGDDVGARMVMDGYAWSYRFRSSSGPYAPQERIAQSERRGIFANAPASTAQSVVYPGIFRKQNGSCRP